MIRKLVVAFALLTVMTPATAYAAAPASTSIEDCLKAGLSRSTEISLALAQRCAPANATIIKLSHGYGIKITSTTMTSARIASTALRTSCATRSTRLAAAGVMDRLDVGACWNGRQAWINWAQTGCYSWLPGAGCFWQSKWIDNSISYVGQASGFYAQNCIWGIPCDGGLSINQWLDGTWDSASWGG